LQHPLAKWSEKLLAYEMSFAEVNKFSWCSACKSLISNGACDPPPLRYGAINPLVFWGFQILAGLPGCSSRSEGGSG
jgi:hypothetical protein